ITNTGDSQLDLGGWKLVSLEGNQQFTFADGTRLAPGESIIVTSGRNARHQPPSILKWDTRYFWANDGDRAELRDGSGTVVAAAE
ncbi:MAG: lamin tail domain-containing protein, partial [Acidobacteria bacterium]|nr:lamin tail domain-containing protein [Acidobacteriota bacterium]